MKYTNRFLVQVEELRNISNELAEMNRLKRLELLLINKIDKDELSDNS